MAPQLTKDGKSIFFPLCKKVDFSFDPDLRGETGRIRQVMPCPYCLVKSQAPLMFCAGGDGGVAQGLFVKSKNSVISGIAASRAVSVGSPQRVSMKCRYAV